jgi:thymidylate kinase
MYGLRGPDGAGKTTLTSQTRFRGRARVGWMFTWAAVYYLVKVRNLLSEAV